MLPGEFRSALSSLLARSLVDLDSLSEPDMTYPPVKLARELRMRWDLGLGERL